MKPRVLRAVAVGLKVESTEAKYLNGEKTSRLLMNGRPLTREGGSQA
jgi:hypothetical protein